MKLCVGALFIIIDSFKCFFKKILYTQSASFKDNYYIHRKKAGVKIGNVEKLAFNTHIKDMILF